MGERRREGSVVCVCVSHVEVGDRVALKKLLNSVEIPMLHEVQQSCRWVSNIRVQLYRVLWILFCYIRELRGYCIMESVTHFHEHLQSSCVCCQT